MKFRPCIDLHQGRVKQIVGATLGDQGEPLTHFASEEPASHFAGQYRRDGLEGGHLIMLGPGNEAAAAGALTAFPGGLQVGGGITPENGPGWLEKGAAALIATSYVFREGRLHPERLEALSIAVGPERLVLDLSCVPRQGRYFVATDRWQRLSDFEVNPANLERLAAHCAEFLIHAVEVEGRQQGIDPELAALLGGATPLPTTYAGGIRNWEDIALVGRLGGDRLDFTVGSALDLFGGRGLRYAELVAFNQRQAG
ncbi:MAG: phosphoribosylformimino-5-aminoimidazole carboxamide ribotide isomerase [Candidatus Handelsmanbacteria bacterium]|nr:phosphoribosylformimino-5-aminoimidazole carboxamide ribotide isomerase [Candidatus Handelsmanbacteria bacterium]